MGESIISEVHNKKEASNSAPSTVFIFAAWLVLLVGITAYVIGLFNADMQLNEKGYYLIVLLYGLFSAVTLQKSIRDKEEGYPVTTLFFGLTWFSTIIAILLLCVGLWNASLELSEKGFYGISYILSLFAAICVQKNVRDSTF